MGTSAVRQRESTLPSEKTVVDVVGVQHGRVTTGIVDEVSGDVVTLVVPLDRDRDVTPEPGSRLELIWKDGDQLLAVPVVVATDSHRDGAVLCVQRTGPATPGQRRSAVRAPLRLPVQLAFERQMLSGITVDVSESGLRCVLDSAAITPSAREACSATVVFGSAVVTGRAEVVRRHRPQDGSPTELSIRFADLPEATQDLIRRQVFAHLRDLRLRGLI
jgi:hypothetical protein